MDKTTVFGTVDAGSIPAGGTLNTSCLCLMCPRESKFICFCAESKAGVVSSLRDQRGGVEST